jgi:predicted phosphodiesterase
MRIAILADIHGNMPALEAVLGALERLQPDQVVVDGDIINAVPFSAQVIDCVRAQPWVVVRGNHEFYYLDHGTARAFPGSDDPERWGQLLWLMGHISPQQGAYLAMLPDECTFYVPGTQPLRIAHGVPGRNRVGFYRGQSDAAMAAEIDGVREQTLISAHTHVQIDRHIVMDSDLQAELAAAPHAGAELHIHTPLAHRHWHVINPGSVGLPLDGRPLAQFAVIDSVSEQVARGGWRVTHHAIAYDRRRALEAYTTTGMLSAGGVMSQLFFWEVITAELEIVRFYRWAFANGRDPDKEAIGAVFDHYISATRRDAYVAERNPLAHRGLWE